MWEANMLLLVRDRDSRLATTIVVRRARGEGCSAGAPGMNGGSVMWKVHMLLLDRGRGS